MVQTTAVEAKTAIAHNFVFGHVHTGRFWQKNLHTFLHEVYQNT